MLVEDSPPLKKVTMLVVLGVGAGGEDTQVIALRGENVCKKECSQSGGSTGKGLGKYSHSCLLSHVSKEVGVWHFL